MRYLLVIGCWVCLCRCRCVARVVKVVGVIVVRSGASWCVVIVVVVFECDRVRVVIGVGVVCDCGRVCLFLSWVLSCFNGLLGQGAAADGPLSWTASRRSMQRAWNFIWDVGWRKHSP